MWLHVGFSQSTTSFLYLKKAKLHGAGQRHLFAGSSLLLIHQLPQDMATTEKSRDSERHSSESSTMDLEVEQPLLSERLLQSRLRNRPRSLIFTATHALLFVASAVFFVSGLGKRSMSDGECAAQLSAYCMLLNIVFLRVC